MGRSYPKHLLFAEDVIRAPYSVPILEYAWRWVLACKYAYVLHYGSLSADPRRFARVLNLCLQIWCLLLRILGTVVVYIPSGCRDHVSKSDWRQVDNGNVCGNCGFEPRCNDRENRRNFRQVRRIAKVSIGGEGQPTSEFTEIRIRYKSLDLEAFRPDISIPREFKWSDKSDIRILHSHSLETRRLNNKNIKGTPFVIEAVNRLNREGHNVELVNLSGIRSSEMRFHQAQADIVVDQLIYGGVGSTTLECLSLGKPVICYLRPSWREFLSLSFPEWQDCPVISATPETIYDELEKLVLDGRYRSEVAARSRAFASKFLDAKKNVVELEAMLLALR